MTRHPSFIPQPEFESVDTEFAVGSARYLARHGLRPEAIARALTDELDLDRRVATRLAMLEAA